MTCTPSISKFVNIRYAPALRPLRPYCHVLHIRPTPSSNLIPRLQKICVLEGLKVDVRALTLLADSNDGDLRACLNNLQLLATKCNHLTIQIVQESLEKAKKEGSLTSHDVVEGIFYKRTAKERRRLNISTENEADRVINDVHACGEYERIISGTRTPSIKWFTVLTSCRMSYTFPNSILFRNTFRQNVSSVRMVKSVR